MKKVFKKNQIIITALALMIAVAGYISYTQSNDGKQQVSKTQSNAQEASAKEIYDISEEDVMQEIFTDTEEQTDAADAGGKKETSQETSVSQKEKKTDTPGETVLTNAQAGTVDFAAEMKLSREQMRSKNKEDLMEIINNKSLTEAQKQDAVNKMVELTNIAERENAAEILLEAKGFQDVVVSITDDGADVVLDMGEVTDAKRAQIEDIMKRKTGVSAENIVITPISE